MGIEQCSGLFLTLILFLFIRSEALTLCDSNPSAFNFRIDSMKATVIYDGPTIFASSAFGVADEDVRRAYDDLFRPSFPFEYSINALVLDHPRGRILIDAGAFNAKELIPSLPVANLAGRLLRNLKASGINPLSISYVLLTHGHADHVLGLIDDLGRRAFPRAEVIVAEKEHLFWSAMSISMPNSGLPQVIIDQFGQAYNKSIIPYQNAGRLKIVDGSGTPLPGIRFIPTPGHSPFHTSIEVTSGRSRVFVVGDAWVSTVRCVSAHSILEKHLRPGRGRSPPDQLRNPDWAYLIEYNSTQAIDSRRRLLEEAAVERILVHVYHEQFPGLGNIRAQGSEFDWVPIGPQQLGTVKSAKCKNV
ncbi:Metallo-beta-lactamase [Gracilaria domingensis]|nr:Metallo-beta-lactamase [Gracilaria domingensis]